MSVINSQPLIGASGNQGGAYNLTRSLRFRSSASAYLSRTISTNGDSRTWTYSTWIKRGALGAGQDPFLQARLDGNNNVEMTFNSNDTFTLYAFNGGGVVFNLTTTQVFRDPCAWYHFVIHMDTTQATSTNRAKIYVNGVQVTSFSTATYSNQNTTTYMSQTTATHNIGRWPSPTQYFDGYLAETYFIDGQALTPSSFGETSTTTGVWIPKAYTGSYGTNGFYLDFEDTSSVAALGYDAAGSNDWTVNNVSLTSGTTYDSMTDVPTLTSATAANYCVLNRLDTDSDITLSAGNLQTSQGAAAGISKGTFGVSSGKWYWEVTLLSGDTAVGIATTSSSPTQTYVGQTATSYGYYSGNGFKYNNGSGTSYGATYTTNDVIGVALDLDAGTLVFYKNNTSQGTAFSSLSGTFTPAIGNDQSNTTAANFGQRPFAYTPPTGFVALNTFNLPTPTIGATASTQANRYFDATTYVGTGSTRSVTNSGGFSPDLVWVKARISAQNHQLSDSIRGTGKSLTSNTTSAEVTNEPFGYVSAFNSDGFSVTAGSSGSDYVNLNTWTYVGWQWRGSDSSAVSNTSGTITSTVSANTSAGFSIVTYTGTGANATVGHGLGVAPRFIIVKSRSATNDWRTYHASAGNTGGLVLNLDVAFVTDSGYWNNTSPTSSVFSIGTNSGTNANGQTFVAYCFSELDGYSKFGSYTGNNNSDGPFIYLGFRPKFVLFKASNNISGWMIADSSRSPHNVSAAALFPNSSNAEYTIASDVAVDFLSNGVKLRGVGGETNGYSGGTFIYAAFAENPFKYANAR